MFKSKTIWFAIAIAAVGALQEKTDLLKTLVTADTFGWIMIVIAIVVAGLRVVTTQPLDEK